MDLVFDNESMIKLLKQRGNAVKLSRSDKIFQLEHLIKQAKLKQYNTDICGVFITFEDDQDKQLAAQILKQTNI